MKDIVNHEHVLGTIKRMNAVFGRGDVLRLEWTSPLGGNILRQETTLRGCLRHACFPQAPENKSLERRILLVNQGLRKRLLSSHVETPDRSRSAAQGNLRAIGS
jgi:hypothetical protein